jgi:hypothetical protein
VGFVVLPPLLLQEYVYVPEGLAVAVNVTDAPAGTDVVGLLDTVTVGG